MRVVPRAAAMLALIVVTGCVADVDSVGRVPSGVITGTVDYDGVAAGRGRPLALAIYRTFPPAGPPARTALVDDYELPYQFTFHGLGPGTYYIGALIDVDRADRRYAGMLNPDLDPHGYAGEGAPVVLRELEGAGGLEIHLVDP